MKYLALLLIVLVFACGENTDITGGSDDDNGNDDNGTDSLYIETGPFGTDSTLDVITWNIEHFPKQGDSTIVHVANLIETLQPDIVALQEIDNSADFYNLVNMLDSYDGIVASHNSLAFVYNALTIERIDTYMIYTDESRPFPRRPFVWEVRWQGRLIYIINNHLKAFGDNYIDMGNEWDEETRRLDACQLLHEYISQNLPDALVIVVGDMNDCIEEPTETNVFRAFLDRPAEYYFADMHLVENPDVNTYSYPGWPSHLDHILISNELFESFNHPASACLTIKAENYLPNKWVQYEEKVSDHRPVGLRLFFE
ncbi:MAG: endonuclease/exonuclease/phosphatase family protein [Candidatus Cloacimonetes bacterium]|nr:endonuclease/exonuclease/phosphatase family protein [Candidatus Cloacimonadota bacterium]